MNKSHLLINEPALQVLPTLAKAIGLEEAIILQQLHYWLNNPKVEGREYDSFKWIFNTYEEWQENFPFWSIQQIQRFFLNLEKGGFIISKKLDAKKHYQKKFYRIDYDALCVMDESILIPSNISESSDVNKELHRLPKNIIQYLQKEIKNVKTSKGIDDIAHEISKRVGTERFPSVKRIKVIVKEYLLEIDEGNASQPETPKKKEDKMNQDIKTVARSRGVSEEMIKFIDRACKAFGFQIMQLDDISLSAYQWIMEKEANGQKIEAFADWARKEEGGKYIGKYRKNGGEIKNDWVRAFSFADDRTSMIKRMS